MSRVVDIENLTSDDLLYLADRGRLTPGMEAQYKEELQAARLSPVDPLPTPTTGDVGTAEGNGGILTPEDSEEDDEGEVPPYSEWKRADLLAEIDARNEGREGGVRISKKGTVAELAESLEEDDE